MPLTKLDTPLQQRAAQAILSYLSGAAISALSAYTLRRFDDPRSMPTKLVAVEVGQLSKAWQTVGCLEHEGDLMIIIRTCRDTDADADSVTSEDTDRLANQTAHLASIAGVLTALDDVAAIRTALNYPAGVTREVQDFHFYAWAKVTQPVTDMQGGMWITEIRRELVCANGSYGGS